LIQFIYTKEFEKDLKKLERKFRSLRDDIEIIKQILYVFPKERPPFSFSIDNLGLLSNIIKIKKIACKAIYGKGVNSGLRIVYAYEKTSNKIIFIELYHKNEKASEDRLRILSSFS
jgi:mRNA-degrading endonuclease RelE of RelBE toxin-antitoxin system